MNAQIAKEFRPLGLPVAMATILASLSLDTDFPPSVIAGMTFFGCVAVLGCISFGSEFQQRTLQLLMTQPASRSRLWRDKMLAVGLAAVALGLLRWRLDLVASRMSPMQLILMAVFLVASVSSAGIWAGRTGSVSVGVLAGVCTQIPLFSLLDWVVNLRYGSGPFDWTMGQIKLVCLSGLVYAAMLAWLGRSFWREQRFKHKVVTAGVTLLYIAYLFARSSSDWSWRSGAPPRETLLIVMSPVAVLCSGCFWTLVARSTIGGMAFSVASLFLTVSLVAGVIGFFAPEFAFDSSSGLALIGGGAGLYSAAFLWLGWRKFARLELRESVPSEGNWSSASIPGLRGRLGWLRCRPAGAVRNLIRKELRLQKPLLTIGALFALCWLAFIILRFVAPAWSDSINEVIQVLTWVYLVLSLLLAGAISLGEDKGLGLEAWHLTLPVAARTQWLVKLGISATVGLLLGIGLPALCEWLLFLKSPSGRLPYFPADKLVAILQVAGLMLVISFWAATFASSTLRALLSGIVSLGVLCGLIVLASWLRELLDPNAPGSGETSLVISLLVVSIAALAQSYISFRRPQTKPVAWVKHSILLATVYIATYVWCATF